MGRQPADDFGQLTWHDNLVYAMRLRAPDPDRDDWRSEVEFDIDHIVEWICHDDNTAQFHVAPATLVFHDVTDLKIAVDYGGGDIAATMNQMSIHDITREQLSPGEQKAFLDRSYYHWRIALNLPQGGEIAFGASGFTQTLRADPVLTDQQSLPAAERA